jgi:hypothetical protein
MMSITITTNMGLKKPDQNTREPASIFATHNPNVDAIDAHDHSTDNRVAVRRLTSGLFSARPVAGNAGHVYIATDTVQIFYDDGTAWREMMVSPMTAQGDLIYAAATGAPERLAKGTAGQVLVMNGAATAPQWTSGTGTGSPVRATSPSVTSPTVSSGNISISAGGVTANQPAGSQHFALDNAGTGQSVANEGVITPVGNANNFSGLLQVNETSVRGYVALFLCGGQTTAVALVAQSGGSDYSVSAGTAGKINVYYSGGVINVQNRLGSTISLQVTPIRIRATS